MGCISSSETKTIEDKRVANEMEEAKVLDRSVRKLLLLGAVDKNGKKRGKIKLSNIFMILTLGDLKQKKQYAGGSGKSTFFKQLTNLHGGGFQNRDRKSFKDQMYEQLIDTMKLMITKCEEFFDDDPKENADFELAQTSQTSADVILATRNNSPMTTELVRHLETLWKDSAIQHAFKIRNKICVPDSTGIFLEKLSIISADDYIPTDEVL
ncbi:G-protein alpha subunit [Reticulomyxa filosa]|uniref:G-protein alpha subunit n=1 Tax=Reticulomyxa filosa TaxID=46433 RepID=X6NXN7_RETFI|nr:G-protein alpha subunit [Reticulomyxa filosa]|eukprot:ETO30756.1 G-protein alpha subunit [Reticulomyxa filosa]